MSRTRKNYTPEEKVAILKRHLVEKGKSGANRGQSPVFRWYNTSRKPVTVPYFHASGGNRCARQPAALSIRDATPSPHPTRHPPT
jgi:hypothetical protein